MKKLFTLILIIAGISINCLGFTTEFSERKTKAVFAMNPDSLNSITQTENIPVVTFTPDTIDGSGTVSISILLDNPDDLYYGYYAIYNPRNEIVYTNYFSDDEISDGVHHHEFDIHNYHISGYWYISDFSLGYTDQFYFYNAEDLNAGFTVINTIADTICPLLRNFNISKDTAYPNDTVLISMQITDSLSGLASVAYYVHDFHGNVNYLYSAFYDGENEKDVELEYVISKYDFPGQRIFEIQGNDMAGNFFHYLSDTISSPLNVIGTVPDTIGPVVKSVKITGNEDGHDAILELVITDENSGLYEFTVTLNNLNNTISLPMNLFVKVNDSLFTCDLFKNKPFLASGNYNITIVAYDSVNHQTFYMYPETLSLKNDNSDFLPPVIVSVRFDKNEYFPGDSVTFLFHITDEKSGISSFYFVISNILDQRNQISFNNSFSEQIVTDYTFSRTYSLPDFGPSGTWRLEYFNINDNSDHYTLLMDEIPEFHYLSKYRDDNPPMYNSLSFEPSFVNAGDSVTAILLASDDYSGIEDVQFYLSSSVQFDISRPWSMINPGRYELKIPVNRYMEPGTVDYSLYSITDAAENSTSVYEYALAFTVINNSAFDNKPPVFDSLTISRLMVYKNDIVNFDFYLHDSISGLDPNSILAEFVPVNTGNSLGIALHPLKAGDNLFRSTLTGSQLSPGEFNSWNLNAKDNAGNTLFLEGFDDPFQFEVADDHEADTIVPELVSFRVFPEVVQPGDTVHAEVKTIDKGYGVLGIVSYLLNSKGKRQIYMDIGDWTYELVNDTAVFTSLYIVPGSAKNDKWDFRQLFIADNALQVVLLNHGTDYFDAGFEVTGGQSYPNRPPRWILNDINLSLDAGSSLEYTIPDYLVADIDGDEMTFTSSMKNGSDLADWISFSPGNLQMELNPGIEIKGNYTILIKATDPEGLYEELKINISVSWPTGVADKLMENLLVYPNPASDFINIECSSELESIKLYDLTGKLKQFIPESSGRIDVSGLDRGIYILRIESANMTSFRKITLIRGN